MAVISQANLLDLAGLIAAAGLDPDRWQCVMQRLHRLTGVRCHIVGQDLANGRTIRSYDAGYDPYFDELFAERFAGRNPWAKGFVHGAVGQPMSADEMYPYDQMVKTDFFADWIRPQEDLSAGGGAVLTRDGSRLYLLGGSIPRRFRDGMEGPWLELVGWLAPLISQALEVNRMLAGARLDAYLLRHGCDAGGAAVIVVTQERRVVTANKLAETLLEQGCHLRTDAAGRFRLGDMRADNQLATALLGSCSGRSFPNGLGPRGYRVRTLPLDPGAFDVLPVTARPFVAAPVTVVVMSPVERAARQDRQVASLLGLTMVEAAITLALMSGQSPREIAEARGTSLHTVRNQIKTAMGKTGTRRQADLILHAARATGPA